MACFFMESASVRYAYAYEPFYHVYHFLNHTLLPALYVSWHKDGGSTANCIIMPCFHCRRSFYHKDISCPKSLPARKCLSFVSFICPCSTLLPGAGARCAHRQQPKTGPGLKAVMGFPPPRFSPGRPHCVIPLLRGCDWTEVSLWAVHVMANGPPQAALGRTFAALHL